MSNKNAKVAALIDPWRGRDLDARYLAYFDCFNRGLFYEAHEVLEELWLLGTDSIGRRFCAPAKNAAPPGCFSL